MMLYQVILLAILGDLILGDPKWLPHPVRWMGFFITYLEKGLRIKVKNLRLAGVLLWLIIVGGTALVSTGILLMAAWYNFWFGLAVNVIMIFYALAIKSLTDEGWIIAKMLKKGDIQSARNRLQTIVSRDCSGEDQRGVIRGTIETITENLSDGVIAPLLFAMIAGGPLALTYKVVNTLDSMVGYKNEKYRDFGWFSARVDDVVNYFPARITGLLIIIVAVFTRQHPIEGMKAWIRDAQKGPSPNGGIPIVTFAGARDIELGGDCFAQDGSKVCIPKVGGKREELSLDDIKWANGFVYLSVTGFVMFIGLLFTLFPKIFK
ncbi:MAG: adenosylcobinamide-phosphate synthase CbiB [Patescibacteria group bacterium]|nr:adenosylcobinamide-phosphate synthase CbiB [Patescibacteria group bacterium]